MTLEEFEASQALKYAHVPSTNVVCGSCGHRRGNHASAQPHSCAIGNRQHNSFYKRQDATCHCYAFFTAEEWAEQEKVAAAEDAEYEAMPFECSSCEERFESREECETLYECHGCSVTFVDQGSGNKCEQCHKFAAKLSEYGCLSCNEGEVEARGDDDAEEAAP